MSNAGDPAGAAAAAAATPSGRAPRLPRWTRQEILVLIEGKRMVEVRGGGRGGRGRVAAAAAAAAGEAAAALEPKWAAVAEYCRRHGVERGPVQCRKRWSNLAGDYKKIKEWERAAAAAREPSFWAMRNDARRERRLPGFFDREVYDILEGRGRGIVAGTSGGNAAGEEETAVRVDEEEEEEEEEKGKEKEVGVAEEPVFDSGRAAGDDTLFSEDEEGELEETPATTQASPPAVVALPISEKSEASRQQSTEQGTSSKDKQPRQQGQGAERGASPTQQQQQQQSGQKRQRTGDGDSEAGEEGTAGLQGKLLEILDRNNRMVAAQLEAQNVNWERDREQRRDQADSLAVVLGRLADALGRIADKL
ncbi:trihelix transcription factor ASR3 isoform X2 [Brachypodium distachyon]|uniref:Myb-like domain-containing protein n=1 Tax=Brachypodium distachyon TaxID=15368 RepID=I1IA13_BRADI|nr:trihelix transcription factor ASR3 isoform X2 [Brachypodium distachyon]KQJ99628.1 hypothetical protein BRADI_3g44370v3 [Brachypodium distachyon]|eukprot:XP_003572566.1 trihelix transcription factor ASR3 isoform X2 [Brachypodium distachyon]